MTRNYKEILNRLPSGWDELSYGQYKEISLVTITEIDEVDELFIGQENTLKTLSVLTGVPIEELRSASYDEVIPMANRIAFTTLLPEYNKNHSIKWKKMDKLPYDSYVNFLTLSKDPNKNMGAIVKDFSIIELSDEEVDQLSMLEVYSAFFTLRKYARRYFKNTINRSMAILMKQLIKELLLIPLVQKFRNRRKN